MSIELGALTSTRTDEQSATPASRATNGVLRGLTAAGVLLSADVHLYLWATGFKDIHVIGPLFLLNAIAGLVIGVVLLVWNHWLPAFLSAGFGAATLAAFYISVTRGLFGLHEVAGGTQQVLAEVAEWVALVGGAALFLLLIRPVLTHHR